MADNFIYNHQYRIWICRICRYCIVPDPKSRARHLSETHGFKAPQLQPLIDYLATHATTLRSSAELRAEHPFERPPIPGLDIYQGYCCRHPACTYASISLPSIKQHIRDAHKLYARDCAPPRLALWEPSPLQTYFTATTLRRYFPVTQNTHPDHPDTHNHHPDNHPDHPDNHPAHPDNHPAHTHNEPLHQLIQQLHANFKQDARAAAADLWRQGAKVPNLPTDKAARIPWLDNMGIHAYLQRLPDAAIQASYRLPSNTTAEGDLVLLLGVFEAMLLRAYESCKDHTSKWSMTQQRAKMLASFRSGGETVTRGYRLQKDDQTLTTYFRTAKQLVTYFYRVVHTPGGHFSSSDAPTDAPTDAPADAPQRPEDAIKATEQQKDLMADLLAALRKKTNNGVKPEKIVEDGAVQDIALEMFYALIAHHVGSQRFASPVVSFIAMLARKIDAKTGHDGAGNVRGSWNDPHNLNSRLSALIWTAQLVIYDRVCRDPNRPDANVLAALTKECGEYLSNGKETAFAHILHWRLYLFGTSRALCLARQAMWSLDGQSVTYDGKVLSMAHVTHLASWAFHEARRLLHGTLLFGTPLVQPLTAQVVADGLDETGFGDSWLTYGPNEKLCSDAEGAVYDTIISSNTLRSTYTPDGVPNLPAFAVYETIVQRFLKLLAVLVHITPAPPLRSPELLSAKWRNTDQPRNIYVMQDRILLHVQYHKGQAHTGAHRDNLRFLPPAVGDLLLVYMAYVQPLRTWLRRVIKPGAQLSPYLWSHLDGTKWKDGELSTCLAEACVSAGVPEFKVAWWRQVAASITKQKFSPQEQQNFDGISFRANGLEQVYDEEELVEMAEMSNHSFHTMNMAYADSTPMSVQTLLDRARRASMSWQQLFAFHELAPPTTTPADAEDVEDLNRRIRRMCGQPRLSYDVPTLLDAARAVHKNRALEFRPGQCAAVLAVLGPEQAEQVVLVQATGSGKTLVVLVGAAVEGSLTTILVLPTVALCEDMQRRLKRHRIKHRVWEKKARPAAKVVLVSAEQATSKDFARYAQEFAMKGMLNRIVVDECHLTITAANYRPCLRQLGAAVRQVPTQTVWLTATLPPSMEPLFVEKNHLVRPTIVRQSTSRPNIRYFGIRSVKSVGKSIVSRIKDLMKAAAKAAAEAAAEAAASDGDRDRSDGDRDRSDGDRDRSDGDRGRFLVYCSTREMARDLAKEIGCQAYIADLTKADKAGILQRWLATDDHTDASALVASRTLVATSALGVGFDYPSIRAVFHAGRPTRMTDFAQESGRAGRDGQVARSYIMVSDNVEAGQCVAIRGDESQETLDRHAMDVYLSGEHCYRGVMSEYLDAPADWRWCMKGDIPCGVCRKVNLTPRPSGTEWLKPAQLEDDEAAGDAETTMVFTGVDEVSRQNRRRQDALQAYKQILQDMVGMCLLCRLTKPSWDHVGGRCRSRGALFKVKKDVQDHFVQIQESGRKTGRKEWIAARFVVCFRCYDLQEVCSTADPESDTKECPHKDMVLFGCWGAYMREGGEDWLLEHFQKKFESPFDYMMWLGEEADMDGVPCIQATRVISKAFSVGLGVTSMDGGN